MTVGAMTPNNVLIKTEWRAVTPLVRLAINEFDLSCRY